MTPSCPLVLLNIYANVRTNGSKLAVTVTSIEKDLVIVVALVEIVIVALSIHFGKIVRATNTSNIMKCTHNL